MRRIPHALGPLLASQLVQLAGGLYDAEHRIESARLYGNIDDYSYYFVDMTVGTPPQRVSVILDTGSGLLAFPCSGCPHCGKHIDPLFDMTKSVSAKWVGCGGDCPNGKGGRGNCKKGHCAYDQSYFEGSSISGFWFEDYVHLGDSVQHNPPVLAKMGCHQNENNLFYTQKANGIFGILGSQTLLRTLFADKEHVDSSIFSICLSTEGGRLTVGGYNHSHLLSPVQYVNQIRDGYDVELTAIVVAGRRIERFHSTIIDSGTTYTYFNHDHYRALRDAIEDHCKAGDCGASKPSKGECWEAQTGLDSFPIVDVIFGEVETKWRPEEYLYRSGKTNKWCYSFHDDGPRTTTTLGASWMMNKEVVFDLKSRRIGIAPAKCPEYVQRPEHVVNEEDARTPTVRRGTGSLLAGSTTSEFPVASVVVAVGVILAALSAVPCVKCCLKKHAASSTERRQGTSQRKAQRGEERRGMEGGIARANMANVVGSKSSIDDAGETDGDDEEDSLLPT